MSRKKDFHIVAGLALLLAYANLIGPHRLIEQLFPNGEFVALALARSLLTIRPPVLASTARDSAPEPQAKPMGRPKPAIGRLPAPRPLAKPAAR